MDQFSNAYRVLVGKPEGKRLLGRPRRTWENNICLGLGDVNGGIEPSGSLKAN